MADGKITLAQPELLSPHALALAVGDTRRKWSAWALCTDIDPEIFFPPNDRPASDAREVCASCPVRRPCLAYAIAADEPSGIWGGLTTEERRTLRRQLRHRQSAEPTGLRSTE
jgi:WhiB family transcriptional regulator, redox-sensing transcriptional regulator